jgi:hypothetical protein
VTSVTEGAANFLINRRMNRSQQIPFSRQGVGILDRCCFAWNKRIDMPWKIMSIGKLEWAYRSWSTRLGIRPVAGCRSISAFLRPDLRGHKACRFVEAGGPSSYAGALQGMQSPPLGSDHVLCVDQNPGLGRLIGDVTIGSVWAHGVSGFIRATLHWICAVA